MDLLFENQPVGRIPNIVSSDAYVDSFLSGEASANVVLAAGISSGKDSNTMAWVLRDYLASKDFRGEFVLIHSNLGLIEHKESSSECQRLSDHLGVRLITVEPKLPMIERWEKRWTDNSNRFIELERVKLMSPFSSADMRFCTSEEKVAPICQNLKKLFPNKFIINAVGIRREESKKRAKKPIWKANKKLRSVEFQTSGIDWHPILDFTKVEVFCRHKREGFAMHPAYLRGNERVSCSFCVLASLNDLLCGLKDEYNHQAFHRIVALEILSTYSFRQSGYLAEIGFEFLTDGEKRLFEESRAIAERRKAIESEILPELLYIQNFPSFQPDLIQTENLADVRRRIGEIYNFDMKYVTARTVYDRYAELIVERDARNERSAKRNKKKAGAGAREEKEMAAAKQSNEIPAGVILQIGNETARPNYVQMSLY